MSASPPSPATGAASLPTQEARDALGVLETRGFVYQTTDDAQGRQALRRLFEKERVSVYVGIDPTAASLHVGHLVAVMALVHLQRAGHRPILIVGGGTGMIGDPTDKTEMRKLLTRETVARNVEAYKRQLARFIDFGPGQALILDNGEWLLPLNYLEFLRDIGRHFSVNRMLAHDCFKNRYESESGLSFLEFNYMLLQAYDFLYLQRQYGCKLQMGGSDQWGNIVAGVELIRRAVGGEAHGMTIPLLMTPDGRKMGKTEKGALWLDAELTSPYDYYQYWVNTHDAQVGQLLRFFTLLEPAEIEPLERLDGAEKRRAKERLAFEATKLCHGQEAAEKAREAAKALFAGSGESLGALEIPTYTLPAGALEQSVAVWAVAGDGGLCASRSEGRRAAAQGGLYLNGKAVDEKRTLGAADFGADGTLLLRAGKKKHLRVRRGG